MENNIVINVVKAGSGSFYVMNCVFFGIISSSYAALRSDTLCTHLLVSDCLFHSCDNTNSAARGGAIYSLSLFTNVSKSCFFRCRTFGTGSRGSTIGTGSNTYPSVIMSSFVDCPNSSTSLDSDCLCLEGKGQFCMNLNFSKNVIKSVGGPRCLYAGTGYVILKFCVHSNLKSESAFGFRTYTGSQDISYCVVVNNTITRGLIWVYQCHSVVHNSFFDQNGNIQMIFDFGSGTVSFYYCYFEYPDQKSSSVSKVENCYFGNDNTLAPVFDIYRSRECNGELMITYAISRRKTVFVLFCICLIQL